MKRILSTFGGVCAYLVCTTSLAQTPVNPPETTPEPPPATAESPRETADPQKNLPADAGAARPSPQPALQNPHGATGSQALARSFGGKVELQSEADPSLAPGVLVVRVVDSQGRGIAGIEVSALETIQSISEGNTAKRLKATTDQSGEARFSGLDTSLRNSYAVSVEYEGASYPVTPFRSLETIGHRITLPVYPKTSDANEARVGLRGFVYVMMHEGEFVFDVLFRVFSLGEKTWQPQPIELSLPKDAQAIQASEEMPGFVVKDGRVSFAGSYPPGQKDVRLGFRIPSHNRAMETFQISLLPRIAEMRVLADHISGLELRVPGFEAVQQAQGPGGNQVLVTRRVSEFGKPSPTNLTIELLGLPTVGPERWYAVIAAALLALAGLIAAFRSKRGGLTEEERRDHEQARKLILADLVLLERSHREGEVGPETYAQARRTLLVALARLEEPDASQTAVRCPQTAS